MQLKIAKSGFKFWYCKKIMIQSDLGKALMLWSHSIMGKLSIGWSSNSPPQVCNKHGTKEFQTE